MKTSGAVLASAAAGLFMLAATAPVAHADPAEEIVRCYGINACKGNGDCGGKGHSCAGENECKGKGYLNFDKETCLKIEGVPSAKRGRHPDSCAPGEDFCSVS